MGGRCSFVLFFLLILGWHSFAQVGVAASSSNSSSSGIPLQVIVVRSAEEARHVLAELENGEDFGELAKKLSIDPTADSGGYMGRVDPDELRAELRDAVKTLRPGTYSAVVHIPSGYTIVRVTPSDNDGRIDPAAQRTVKYTERASTRQLPAPLLDTTKVSPPSAYTGEAACAQCHAKEAKAYATTPHALDSTVATAKTILGNFSPEHAVLRTRNPNLAFRMVAARDGFYQTATDAADPQEPPSERKIDIVIGSGRHGQTYLHWEGDKLFEMPVSYWTSSHGWVNSPGYPDGELHWDRAVGPRCLECHASYFSWQPMPVNRYDRKRMVLGIDCERCHGPGAQHVARERSEKPPRRGSAEEAIANPAQLSRDQQLSLCSLCHGGGGPPIKTPMSFVVGDNIRDYLKIIPPPANAPVDVHGNQVGALEQSKCFASGRLTCSTCHNVHRTQENADGFSSRCLTCHRAAACGEYPRMGKSIRGCCIDCHMPEGKSNAITTANAGQSMQLHLRTHRIAIYPDASVEFAGGSDREGRGGGKSTGMR